MINLSQEGGLGIRSMQGTNVSMLLSKLKSTLQHDKRGVQLGGRKECENQLS